MTSYNHEPFVVSALRSVAEQTYRDIELLVVDDASTDKSVARAREWLAINAPTARLISGGPNVGICRRLNDALSHARGEYIAKIDADDWIEPERIERQLCRMLEGGPRTGVVYSDIRRVDGQARPMPDESYLQWILGPEEEPPSGDVYRRLLGSNFVPASAALVRRQCLEELGGYDESLVYEDYDMWLRIAERGYRFAFEPGMLANYRILETSLSSRRACQFAADRIRILKKHDKPNGAQEVVRQRIGAIARRMYVDSCDRNPTRRALRSALRVEPSLENLTFWVAATLGVRYEAARRAKRFLPR